MRLEYCAASFQLHPERKGGLMFPYILSSGYQHHFYLTAFVLFMIIKALARIAVQFL